MNNRTWLGSFLWVAGFNLIVALIAFFSGIGWAVAILCLRHVLLGIPKVYDGWRKFVIGHEAASSMPELSVKEWPNRKWFLEAIVCTCISVVAIIWLNFSVEQLLLR